MPPFLARGRRRDVRQAPGLQIQSSTNIQSVPLCCVALQHENTLKLGVEREETAGHMQVSCIGLAFARDSLG